MGHLFGGAPFSGIRMIIKTYKDNIMNPSLAEFSVLLEEDFKAFSLREMFAFFPEPLSTSFQIGNDIEAELLFSIISHDPFTVREDSRDHFYRPNRKTSESISASVAVVEDIELDFAPVEFTIQFSNQSSALELK
jgi:hypothetical protein